MWLGAETSGVPRAPIVPPQPQVTHLCLKLGGISSKHGDILIYSFIPESSEAQGGHMPALQGFSPGQLKQRPCEPKRWDLGTLTEESQEQ